MYAVNMLIAKATLDAAFVTAATAVFDPPTDSLAERVSQGLGWLTRGRASPDRAERLLYFFTAIEALLSSADKNAPVVQTIARHGAVLWSNDMTMRAAFSSEIKKQYEQRSAVVHNGNRSVFWSNANVTQRIAEGLFWVAVTRSDLQSSHASFVQDLSLASYGLVWPLEKPSQTSP